MTREEAIYCLKSYQPDAPDDMCQKCKYYKSVKLAPNVYTCISDKAREMAIQALSQEPCKDAISREAVLDALLDYWHDIHVVDGSGYDVYEDCKAVIDELPSVTQKSGKWINDENHIPICNKCGYIPPYDRAIDDYEYSNFCPNCGAKMVEPQESEE